MVQRGRVNVATVIEKPSPIVGGHERPQVTTWLVRIWPRIGLSLVLLLSAVLEFVALNTEGYANTYYAAGVKSMLTSWHNFFFVSFDAGGFVTIDKPPLGLWIEALSAKLLGSPALAFCCPRPLPGSSPWPSCITLFPAAGVPSPASSPPWPSLSPPSMWSPIATIQSIASDTDSAACRVGCHHRHGERPPAPPPALCRLDWPGFQYQDAASLSDRARVAGRSTSWGRPCAGARASSTCFWPPSFCSWSPSPGPSSSI